MHKYTAKNKYILKKGKKREELIKLRTAYIYEHERNKWQII